RLHRNHRLNRIDAGYCRRVAVEIDRKSYRSSCRSFQKCGENIGIPNSLNLHNVVWRGLTRQRITVDLWKLAPLQAGAPARRAGVEMVLHGIYRAGAVDVAFEPEITGIDLHYTHRVPGVVDDGACEQG